MKVRIVLSESSWILEKFALKLQQELSLISNTNVTIDHDPDLSADVNHYIIYNAYKPEKASACDTLMITHIDDIQKLSVLKHKLTQAKVGICMSSDTVQKLIATGVEPARLCYINPAHDNEMPYNPIRIGICTRLYYDGRKRENLVEALADEINSKFFEFEIMGEGWEKIVEKLKAAGFKVIFHPQFDKTVYKDLIGRMDYYLYMGQDEGSMGYLDALAAGKKTIVTPQGFHLDVPGGITHAFNTKEELIRIFKTLEVERKGIDDVVSAWTWKNYAVKHYTLWRYLLYGDHDKSAALSSDGLNSLLNKSSANHLNSSKVKWELYKKFLFYISQKITKVDVIKRKLGIK